MIVPGFLGTQTKMQLPKFLTDAGWVQVILAVIAIVLTIYYARRELQRKEISYLVLSCKPLFRDLSVGQKKIQLLVDSKPAKNVYLVPFWVKNTGNQPIEPADFFVPLNVVVPSDIEVLSREISEQRPSDLDIHFDEQETGLVLNKTLLNPGDAFSISLLVDNPNEIDWGRDNFSLNGRIRGGAVVDVIEAEKWGDRRTRALLALYLPFVLGLFITQASGAKLPLAFDYFVVLYGVALLVPVLLGLWKAVRFRF